MPAWSLYPTLFSPACDAFETPELPGQVAQPRTLRCAGKSCQSSYAGLDCTCGSSFQSIVLALAVGWSSWSSCCCDPRVATGVVHFLPLDYSPRTLLLNTTVAAYCRIKSH